MSTRGLFGFVKNGKYYLTYNHYDSDPAYLGRKVLQFIREITDTQLESLVSRLVPVSDEGKLTDEDRKRFADALALNEEVDKQKAAKNQFVWKQPQNYWYGAIQHFQAADSGLEFYKKLADSDAPIPFIVDNAFIKDSLYCEYAYALNLDKKALEVYKGWQKASTPGNRFGEEPNKDGLYPCRCVEELSFDRIREADDTDAIYALVRDMEKHCEQ